MERRHPDDGDAAQCVEAIEAAARAVDRRHCLAPRAVASAFMRRPPRAASGAQRVLSLEVRAER